MSNELEENLIIYDVRGIQKYIYRSNKIKEVTGASYIVENLLKDTIKQYCNKNDIEMSDWCSKDKIYDFCFFKNDKTNKGYIEYVYEGGGNLLLATRLTKFDLDEFNKYIQLTFLKSTYSLCVAYATLPINKDTDYINYAYPEIKRRLNDVKKKMPLLSLAKALPICEIDPSTGYALGITRQDQPDNSKHYSYESNYKLENYKKCSNNELDKLFNNDDIKNSAVKTMIAVVHIDGNDMGGIISSYMQGNKRHNMTFEDGVKLSRNLSFKINKVFKYNVYDIISKYSARIVINSGDDITFISKSENAINITKEIMEEIESNYLGDDKNNIFTSCAGIAFTHRHFPFYKAYEIAEECCSIAKTRAKKEENKYRLNINSKQVLRPKSYIDFEIINAGVIKDVSYKKSMNSNLYLRPYLVKVKHDNINFDDNNYDIEYLLDNIKLFKNSEESNVSRNAVKEIRNTYEESEIKTKLLFLRLKSRHNLGNDFDYIPYGEFGTAKYYDATTLIDIISGGSNDEC